MHALPSCRTAKTGDLGNYQVSTSATFQKGGVQFPPPRGKIVLKKKNSQTKGTNSIPTKKNWDPLLKNAKRFPNISHRICRCPTHPIHPHLQVTWSWLPMRTKPAASSKPQHHKPRKQSAMASQNTQVSCYQCWLQIPLDFIHIQYI